MPLRKIDEGPRQLSCTDPEHMPPSHMLLEPGLYEHTCPACGQVRLIRVEGGSWSTDG